MKEGDHRAGRLADDLADQVEGVLGGDSEPDDRNIGLLPRRQGSDLLHVDLACDHVVAQADHDPGKELEAVALLVRDQDSQMLQIDRGHQTRVAEEGHFRRPQRRRRRRCCERFRRLVRSGALDRERVQSSPRA